MTGNESVIGLHLQALAEIAQLLAHGVELIRPHLQAQPLGVAKGTQCLARAPRQAGGVVQLADHLPGDAQGQVGHLRFEAGQVVIDLLRRARQQLRRLALSFGETGREALVARLVTQLLQGSSTLAWGLLNRA